MPHPAILTGGTRGLGRAIAMALKAKGYRVAATYLGNDANALSFQAATGIPIFKWDVADFEACQSGTATVVRQLGSIGILINVTSINGHKGQFGQTNYCASKAGITGFTKALALEEARNGITVNCVAPGYCATDMVSTVPTVILQKIVAEIPVQKLGEPADVARAVVFLAAPDAGFITGATLSVNGGQYMS